MWESDSHVSCLFYPLSVYLRSSSQSGQRLDVSSVQNLPHSFDATLDFRCGHFPLFLSPSLLLTSVYHFCLKPIFICSYYAASQPSAGILLINACSSLLCYCSTGCDISMPWWSCTSLALHRLVYVSHCTGWCKFLTS